MTKITIELEDGTIREIHASSYALHAIVPGEDRLIISSVGEDSTKNCRFLAASLLAGFIGSANQMYENMDHGEMTIEEFVSELAELADTLLEIGEDDA